MNKTTLRILSYTLATLFAGALLYGCVALVAGGEAAKQLVTLVAGLAEKASPGVTAVIAIWGAAKWVEAQREKKRLAGLVPFVLTDGKAFLTVCAVARGLFSPEGRANWVGTAVAPYAGTDGGKKRFADLPGLAAAQALIFPRILAGEIDVFVLKVSERELGFFKGGVEDVRTATENLEAEYPTLVADYQATLKGPDAPAQS